MMSRVVLLVMLASRLAVTVLVEQPGSSLMMRHPRWLQMVDAKLVLMYKLRFFMGAFGSCSLKPTVVYSTSKELLCWIENCSASFRCREFQATIRTTKITRSATGRKQVTGLPTLKKTQPRPQCVLGCEPLCVSGCSQDLPSSFRWQPGCTSCAVPVQSLCQPAQCGSCAL